MDEIVEIQFREKRAKKFVNYLLLISTRFFKKSHSKKKHLDSKFPVLLMLSFFKKINKNICELAILQFQN